MLNKERIQYLLKQYFAGNITAEERTMLFEALAYDHSEEWEDSLQQLMAVGEKDPLYKAADWEHIVNKILQFEQLPAIRKNRKYIGIFSLPRLTAAAAVLLIVTAGIWFWWSHDGRKAQQEDLQGMMVNDVPPGGNSGILTLGDGSQIMLDSAGNGTLLYQGNAQVIKAGNGQLTYNNTGSPGKVSYNTLTTPRGGQYRVTLPDGTRVWLNAASSLTYPTAFTDKQRVVELTGEGYFEVMANAAKPFHVKVNQTDIAVLGTSFNVMAYGEEKMQQTTLLEGAIQLKTGEAAVLLKPGQQGNIDQQGTLQVLDQVDLEEVTGWKNGVFQLNSADIPAVMRQISRWYNVEVVYEGKMPEGHISGKIAMDLTLAQVLKVLELSGLHYPLENKKIIVM